MQLSDLVGDFDVRPEVQIATPSVAPAAQILLQNPMRWAFIFSSNTVVTAFVSRNPGLVVNKGYVLPSTAPVLALNFRDVGPIVCDAWYGFASGVGGTIAVTEIWYRPLDRDGDYARTLKEWSEWSEGMRA